MKEIEIDGHTGKTERDQQPEDRADRVDQALVPRIPQAEGLHGRLESMTQVIGEQDECKHIERAIPSVCKGLNNEKIRGRCRVVEPERQKERPEVDHQEDEYNAPRKHGVARPDWRILIEAIDLVIGRAGGPIFTPHEVPADDVTEEAEQEDKFDRPNDEIACHELGIRVKRFSAIADKQQKVANEMFDEERTEEETREAHRDLLPDRRLVERDESIHVDEVREVE